MIFEHRETVRFGHVDAAGIVFYPRIHEWISNTVEAWFTEALDAPYARLHVDEGVGVPIVQNRCEFRLPSRLGEELLFSLRLLALGRCTFDCAVVVSGSGEERVRAEARHIFVQLDPLEARTIPDWLRARMQPYLT